MKVTHVASLLLQRLERISVDSIWAHRASGVRGSLLRAIEKMEGGEQVDERYVDRLIVYGFQILESVTREKSRVTKRIS